MGALGSSPARSAQRERLVVLEVCPWPPGQGYI